MAPWVLAATEAVALEWGCGEIGKGLSTRKAEMGKTRSNLKQGECRLVLSPPAKATTSYN